MAELIDLVSANPCINRYDASKIREIIADRLQSAYPLSELKPRVIEDLLKKGFVDASAAKVALRDQFKADNFMLRRLKLNTVRSLVTEAFVSHNEALSYHVGYRVTALQT